MTSLIELEEPYRSIQAEARAVAARLEPVAVEADRSDDEHPEVRRILSESGLLGYMVPGAFGGKSDQIDSFAVCLVREAIMAVSAQADSMFALQGIGSYAIARAGSPEQQAEWLPKVASGEVLAALALTEPEAGSDLKGLTTSLVEQGGELVINGTKSFISNAGVAGFYTTLCKEGDGFSLVLVPADIPGLSTSPAPSLVAPHVIGDVVFDHVVVPASARLGEPGRGFDHVLATLSVFRVSVAGAAVGLAQVALEEATRHTRTREQFGRPLARLGPVAGHLADAWAQVAAARLLTYQAARLAGTDPLANLEYSSLAKVFATETATDVIDRCIQVMGRWGVIADSRVERCYRQIRPMRIYEGTSEVLRLGIARKLCQEVE